jgi:hypothetical protein
VLPNSINTWIFERPPKDDFLLVVKVGAVSQTVTVAAVPPVAEKKELPKGEPIAIAARDIATGSNVQIGAFNGGYGPDVLTDNQFCSTGWNPTPPCGPGIAGLLTPPPVNRKRSVEYHFPVFVAGRYKLEVEYAAAVARPTRILVNGKLVGTGASLSDVTGGWDPGHQKWHDEGTVVLANQMNRLRLERDGEWPHIRQFRLVPL